MLKRLGKSRFVIEALGVVAYLWLRLVRATSRMTCEPADFVETVAPSLPVIAAMWHGQHFAIHYAWPKGAHVSALISRHGDGELNAAVLRRLGVHPVRGSGGTAATMRRKGGAPALREMLRRLAQGSTMVLTADVPKVSRRCGPGIVTLAQMSGRTIHAIAVVSNRRHDFQSWDRASLPLPFGHIGMVLGEAITVPRDAGPDALEQARLAVERSLDAAHARAYALVGSTDPGVKTILPGAEPRTAGGT